MLYMGMIDHACRLWQFVYAATHTMSCDVCMICDYFRIEIVLSGS